MTNANLTHEVETDEIAMAKIDAATEARWWQVSAVTGLAGFSVYCGLMSLPKDATLGTGIAFAGFAGMVAVVCFWILRVK